MLKNKVYVGNINTVQDGEISLYQNTNPLLSLGNGYYINLEWISSLKDYLKLYRALITGDRSDDIVLSEAVPESGIYVDKDSLVPYYDENDNKRASNQRISVNKVKYDFLLDPRIPRGIDYQGDGTAVVYIRRPNPNKVVKVKTL